MRKNIAVILAALLLCTACQSKAANSGADSSEPTSSTAPVESTSSEPAESTSAPAESESSAPEQTEASTPAEAEVSQPEDSTTGAFFKPGVWQCSDYYFYEFYEDGKGGSAMDFDSFLGQPFEYEVTDPDSGAVMFHMFSADDQSPATAKVNSDTEIELTWDFGRTDTLTYLPGKTMDDIEAEFKNYFKPGTWRGESGYFFFNEDGESGSTASYELGIGVAFRYEVMSRSEGFVNMHMGAEDNSEGIVISDKTEDSFTLTWEDGRAEKFAYVTPLGADELRFYTDEELIQIALKYYQANNDYTPQNAGVQYNENGSVTIQLYDSFDDHNSTAAWYTIDRVALIGTDDMTGEDIDMSGFAE